MTIPADAEHIRTYQAKKTACRVYQGLASFGAQSRFLRVPALWLRLMRDNATIEVRRFSGKNIKKTLSALDAQAKAGKTTRVF